MPQHLQRDLDQLSRLLLAMGTAVEQAVRDAITAVVDRRPDLAIAVEQGDDRLDQQELAVEELCLKLLALHQPVAGDLRYLVTVLKVNNDLERMGDVAAHIAERAHVLSTLPPLAVPMDFVEEANRVRQMVRDALDALVRRDPVLARQVCGADEAVDATHRKMYATLQALMRASPDNVERAVHTLSVSRHLERIADLATNIAEDVVFLVEGAIIRHQHDPAPTKP